jgi:hypothetical protein
MAGIYPSAVKQQFPGAISGITTEITDPTYRTAIIRKVLQNAGLAGSMQGYNPFRISDDDLARKTTDMPLLCLTPTGLGSGACDPGGWVWITMTTFTMLLVLVLWLILR